MGNTVGKTTAEVDNVRDNEAETTKQVSQTLDEILNDTDGVLPRHVTAILIGAGNRGSTYANFALDFPSRLKIVAVAEPKPHRRHKIQKLHEIAPEFSVDDWRKLAEFDKLADLAIICTQDQFHKEPAVLLAGKGYHLLLEKPMAVTEQDCEEIAEACERNSVIAAVCHVLRYYPPCVKIREIIDRGLIGKVVNINHNENILYWHFAHSYVRGNWRRVDTSTFSLMAKCCHDIDLITYWLGDRKCVSVHSSGGLYHFKRSERPDGAASRCLECAVEQACPYSAQKVYLSRPNDVPRWPMAVVCDIEDHPKGYRFALTEALREGPYGRCVYDCDNDVCDHQVVTMEFEDGATVTMTMNAFTKNMGRETRISGTHGELRWDGGSNHAIQVYDFRTGATQEIYPDKVSPPCKTWGHDGADFFLVNSVLKAIVHSDPSYVSSNITESLRSHKLVFLAEKSRLENTVERID